MNLTFALGENTNEINVFEGETKQVVCLTTAPSSISFLVQDALQSLMGQLNTKALFKNLVTCTDLFGIAYNAVNGMEDLQKSVWKLRQNFITTVIDSADGYVNEFIKRINKVPGFYAAGVKGLLATPMKAPMALKAFQMITVEADAIMKKSQDLVVIFQKLADEASDIATKVIDAKAIDITKRKELEANVEILKGQMKGLDQVKADLEDEIDELTEKYNKLDKRIDKAADQQFWLNITSAVAGALGAGFSTYCSSKKVSIGNTSGESAGNGSTTAANTQSSLDATIKKIEETNKTITDLTKKIEDKDKELTEEKEEEKKTTLKADKKNLTDQKELAESNLALLKAQQKSYQDIIAGIGAGLSNLSDKLDKQGEKIGDAVASLTEMADNIATKRAALRKEKRDILCKLAEYTQTVENSVAEKNDLNLAIAALSAGIGAMNYIVSVLNDFYKFWKRIKVYAESMASGEIETYFELYQDMPDELKSLDFFQVIATNASQWVALKLVLEDYQNSFHDIYNRLQAQLKEEENADQQVMWKRAITKSQGMSEILKAQAQGIQE